MILIVIFLSLMVNSLDAKESPRDYAVALRDTQIYESLETYADIIGTAKKNSYYHLINIVEDQYGIKWAEVKLDSEGKVGYFTDMLNLRMTEADLKEMISEVKLDDVLTLDQEIMDKLASGQVEVGMSKMQLFLAKGMPEKSTILGCFRGQVGRAFQDPGRV